MKENIELRVCKGCDAPLPCSPESESFFTKGRDICDDCLKYERESKVKR